MVHILLSHHHQDAAIHYPQLQFPVDLFMTMGSPIGLFLVVREQAR